MVEDLWNIGIQRTQRAAFMRVCWGSCWWMLPIIPARADVPTIGQFIITPDVVSLAIKTFHLHRYYVILHLKWFTVRVTFTVEQQWGAVISSEGVVLRKTAAAGRTRRMARTLPCSSTTRLRIMTVAFHRTSITIFIMWVRMSLTEYVLHLWLKCDELNSALTTEIGCSGWIE